MGIEISHKQAEQFIKYKDILLEWNRKMNLTTITEERKYYNIFGLYPV